MKKCPSCGGEPSLIKDGGVRYSHTESCKLGKCQQFSSGGCLGLDPYRSHQCKVCKTWFTVKPYVNEGDSHTKECPICWVMEEAKQNGKDQGNST